MKHEKVKWLPFSLVSALAETWAALVVLVGMDFP